MWRRRAGGHAVGVVVTDGDDGDVVKVVVVVGGCDECLHHP